MNNEPMKPSEVLKLAQEFCAKMPLLAVDVGILHALDRTIQKLQLLKVIVERYELKP